MRLPRKDKKRVKKIVARKTATKIVMSAVMQAQTMAQLAIIAATPNYNEPAGIALKALRVVENISDTAKAISRIMSEPPNSWRDFARAK